MESLQIMKYASKALSKATKSLIILDSVSNSAVDESQPELMFG